MQPVNPTPLPYFDPMPSVVTGITNANPAVVTTSVDHQFSNGDAIRMIIPPGFGMTEINRRIFPITVLSPTTFSLQVSLFPYPINFDSTALSPFILATGLLPQVASAICIGSLPIENSQHTYFETRLDDQVVNTLVQSGGSP